MKTTGYSSPLALCSVMSVTRSSLSRSASWSEPIERLDGGRPEAGYELGDRRDLGDRLAHRVGVGDDAADRGLADPALRGVDDASERDRVRRVDKQREVGERVLDLGALVELRAPDHLVGDAEAHKRVFEHAALRVRPVEDGDVARRDVLLVAEALDLRGDEATLGVL